MSRIFICAWIAILTIGLAHANEPVIIASETPYEDPREIQKNVREECTSLNSKLAQFSRQYAQDHGIEIVYGDPDTNEGRALRMTITEAISRGNAFIGHRKSTTVHGTLVENGQDIASFRAKRNSGGGFGGGFKGSCSVLGRTVKTLGKDIAQWLANPEDDAWLGNY